MTGTIEFCFDFVSPMSYFAFHRLKGVRERTGCKIIYRPIWLFEVMKQTGNKPPGSLPPKRNFYFADTKRHAKRFDLPWNWNTDFPMNTLHLLRMAEGITDVADQQRFIETCFHGVWGEPRNVSDMAVTRDMLEAAGFDPVSMFSLSEEVDVIARVKANTQSAIDRGMFGAPTFFVEGELYFGQDRLDFVEDAVSAKAWV